MTTTTTITTFIGGALAVTTAAGFDPMVGYLTGCCGAAVTGTTRGYACKACYAEVDCRLADGWTVSDADGWARCAGTLEAMLGLPTEWAWKLALGAWIAADEAVEAHWAAV
jgi:hypothetical protein